MKKAVFVVTKSQGSDTTLAQHIKKLGYAVEVNPAIETRAMLSPEAFTEMRSKIQQALYEGIVFTSVRAVHILAQQNGFPFPEYLPIFAQSESTALAVKENFGRQALIPHDRFVSEAVADLVAHQLNAGAVVCFPAAK
ncbi:MAG: uroporphyrinogen-III synthase, partial [Bdellovibrionales bacterium]|nr:uroporphyrinogen-III synthase [Bdellovibrionales bacterium]